MSTRRSRVDQNQAEIVAALRHVGCSVQSLAAVGHGVPDLLVGHHGRTFLVEVKTRTGRLTKDQVAWSDAWRGAAVRMVRSVDEALQLVRWAA